VSGVKRDLRNINFEDEGGLRGGIYGRVTYSDRIKCCFVEEWNYHDREAKRRVLN
jgi:hypothetical protein